jgi:hypothetical protein
VWHSPGGVRDGQERAGGWVLGNAESFSKSRQSVGLCGLGLGLLQYKISVQKPRSFGDLLVVCAGSLLFLTAVLLVATHADFSSGLIFPAVPLTGRIRPALHARRPRGCGDVQLVLLVARYAQFSSGLILAVVPLNGRIRPALHARRPRGRGDVQPVLRVARAAHFISGLIFAVEPLNGCMRPAIHARRPRGVSMASTCEEYGTLTT